MNKLSAIIVLYVKFVNVLSDFYRYMDFCMGAMFIITIITTLKTAKTFILCQLFSFLNKLKMMNSLFFSSNSKQNATNYELS